MYDISFYMNAWFFLFALAYSSNLVISLISFKNALSTSEPPTELPKLLFNIYGSCPFWNYATVVSKVPPPTSMANTFKDLLFITDDKFVIRAYKNAPSGSKTQNKWSSLIF